jgi:hypothetical protein
MDRLTSQLSFLPRIIGNMGREIGEAQKLLNADYVENIARLMQLISEHVAPAVDAAGKEASPEAEDTRLTAIADLLKAVAPARYQFTETTIDFSADLAETKSRTASGAVGVGLSGVTVNAGMTLGFGYDYRSAARITSVLHAREVGAAMTDKLLERATAIRTEKLDLPERSAVEERAWTQTANVIQGMFPALESGRTSGANNESDTP